MENDVYNLNTKSENNNDNQRIELSYYQARFTQKCGAILLDFLLFAFVALGIFIGVKAIVESNSYYVEINQNYNEARINSKLYVDNPEVGRIEDVVTYLNRSETMSAGEKENYLLDSINGFFDSLPNDKENLINEFEDYVLRSEFLYEGNAYYIKDESGVLIKNPNYSIPSLAYYSNVLSKYFDEVALAQFTILTPNVLEYQRFQSNMLLFVEIPSGIVLSAILIWYIVPICFFRGKKSFGRFAFHIGLLGPDNFSLKIGRFTIRFLIFLFAEVLLSLFTFCIPLIISISMSAFSKKKQNFHDYMLNIREIDTYGCKVFLNKFEVVKSPNNSGPVDFRLREKF